MFWKNVKNFSIFRSVILRLTFLYTVSILAILMIISSILYFSLREDLRRNEHQFLYSESVFLKHISSDSRKTLIKYLHHEKHETLEDYWETLLSTSIIGIISAGLVGFFLAHRSMRPFKDIAQAMKQTTISQLQYRLDPQQNWPKEFTHLAKHFNEMLDRLETSFNRLSQFSADLAHELRTPINNLKGETEICLMKDRPISEYQQVLGSNLEEYQRLSRMIENLLFLARAESPKKQLTYTKIPLRKMIENVVEFYTQMAEEKNITFSIMGDEDNQLALLADELLFERVLHNLCSNALRYTHSGGNITLSLASYADKITIQIIDTGIGVAAEHLPHLFERFYRTDSARNQESGGSGLGLAIVKSIMDLHHATIHVNSAEGEGTTVTLIFNAVT
jgi:two-component system heavy metal sensor histidine kinase CusS